MTAVDAAQGPNAGDATRRAPVWAAMAVIAAASWIHLGRMDMGPPAPGGGGAGALAAAFLMWAVMMVAMMLPTVAPSASVFSRLSARREPLRGHRATASFVAGYALSWVAFAGPAALLQWVLTRALLLDPMARSTSALLSAMILIAAGIYQCTPLKAACLSRCRSPLAFFMAQWRDGASGALLLGLRFGSYCVACCWALMAVMFVVGAMNLVWMALLTLLLLGEKVMPARWRFDRVIGVSLVASGLWTAAGVWVAG